jgi:NAD(P)-dependent dehydrogenase (short-subunit alcohol dehydrogenase family)
MPQDRTNFSFDLGGRTALITGASSGIGRRFAQILARSGAAVVLGARRLNRLEDLQQEIARDGGKALAVAIDVADEASVAAAYDAAEAAFGMVDTIVANAGINAPGSTLGLPVDDFDQIFAVNTRGAFLTAREGARRMINRAVERDVKGRVVLISSVTASHPPAASGPYAASKAAVSQLGRTMAKDWATKGVNVNVLEPGYILTELTDGLMDSPKGRQLFASFPRGRLMDEGALDAMLLYLCSDASDPVTGSVFTIDDGQML